MYIEHLDVWCVRGDYDILQQHRVYIRQIDVLAHSDANRCADH